MGNQGSSAPSRGKVIVVTYDSGEKSWLPRTVESLDYIASYFGWIRDVDLVDPDDEFNRPHLDSCVCEMCRKKKSPPV